MNGGFLMISYLLTAIIGSIPPNADIATLSNHMASGQLSAEEMTSEYLTRINQIDRGPHGIRSILAVNQEAIADARDRDTMRKQGDALGPLHGIPIVIKDNIEFSSLPTTAGSLALASNRTHRDSPLVARLQAAGAIILAKTNLSEWANFRSPESSSGWSAVGGLTRNPYNQSKSACGSSSGSGAAIAAELAAAAIGTETDGSITCPAAMNGLVGLKPTVGLIPRTHIVPIADSQDTAGPMTRTVRDAALLLGVMAGPDSIDITSAKAPKTKIDYASELDQTSLHGARIGVLWFHTHWCEPSQLTQFEQNLEVLRNAGAELIDIQEFDGISNIYDDELTILLHEFKDGLNAYLSTLPGNGQPNSIQDIISFNKTHAEKELQHFGQEFLIQAAETDGTNDHAYQLARDRARDAAGPNGIDRLIEMHQLDAMVAPTTGPAFDITLGDGDAFAGASTTLPAVSGYPHLTVPAGHVDGLPVGLSFIGPAWSEATLLSLGYAFEQRGPWRLPPQRPQSSTGAQPSEDLVEGAAGTHGRRRQ